MVLWLQRHNTTRSIKRNRWGMADLLCRTILLKSSFIFSTAFFTEILNDDKPNLRLQNIKEMTKAQHLDSTETLKSKVKQLGRNYNLCVYDGKDIQQNPSINNAKCTQQDLYLALLLYGIYILDEFLHSDKVCESMDTLFN
ncbi:hypothetical protein DMC01_05550 [Campylobacter troglodytis]|nr:hypothetical protein DMC01_05550 [Campylobacter troglodytis]